MAVTECHHLLEKDKESLRVINRQFKVNCASQRPHWQHLRRRIFFSQRFGKAEDQAQDLIIRLQSSRKD